ncbi:hypothetical protein Cgig2_018202 [Carnegiea gigantea]|uniref:Uncharacterized protein n=1 Tax=Carnegiea gigantea TaxID=171969 RepID=A0A9Q1KXV6_9CARY|nr:hypothetical protein Cgig2_018202 [Carnegiea gigantea]
MATWEGALVWAISAIGFLSLSKTILQFVKWVYCMFLRPPKNLTATYGSWALVTGSTDGIGKALTFELASKGLNLVLVGRNPHKLKSTSHEILDKFGKKNKTQIKAIAVDLEKVSGEEIEGKIRREIQGLEIGVLINNAGSAAEGPRFFHENSREDIDRILKVNIGGVCWVTKAVLPGMLKRKKGAILNIGSGASAVLPSFPFSAVYAATKAFVATFSLTLCVEYKEHGIDIQCQVPMYVATKMISNTIDGTSFFVPSPEKYSKASVRWIGYESLCIPHFAHALEAYLLSVVPDSVLNNVVFLFKLRLRNKRLRQLESAKPMEICKMGTWEDALVLAISTIGFLSLAKPILKFVKWVYCMFLRPPKNLTATYGSWALVTGSTDGIGKALTFELASKGLNLVLVGRNPHKLKSTSHEILDKFGKKNKTQIKTIAVDLEKVSGEEIEGKIRREIQGLEIGVLINNAGSTVTGPRFFHENSREDIDRILKVNIEGVCWVTKAVLPGMLKREKGAILNIGSGASAVLPSFPFSAIYAATKACVATFSRILCVEYKEHGIDIQCQVPMYVATKMISNSVNRTSFFVPSPEKYSKATVGRIGYEPLCIPYLAHALQAFLLSLVPEPVLNHGVFHTRLRMRSKITFQEESTKPLLNHKH